jgi:hypothetical protein
MTALAATIILVVYVFVPGVLFRAIFSAYVPLKKFQTTKTEEITFATGASLIPFALTLCLVWHVRWFGNHPFSFPDSTIQKWADYKIAISSIYSEQFFKDNQAQFWQAISRIWDRQRRVVCWYYAMLFGWAMLLGSASKHFGYLQRYGFYNWIAAKVLLPNLFDWYIVFAAFTFPQEPKLAVMVDAITSDDHLYRGQIGNYSLDKDGDLTGFLLENACRFDRKTYLKEKDSGVESPSENYWKTIPGNALYISAKEVVSLNVSYVIEDELAVAQQILKKVKLRAIKVEKTKPVELEPHVSMQAEDKHAVRTEPQAPSPAPLNKNFSTCPHCKSKGRPDIIVRITENTPLISRSDGATFHLFLQDWPAPQYGKSGGIVAGRVIIHFRYAQDNLGLQSEPIAVVLSTFDKTRDEVVKQIEDVADLLAEDLRSGKRLSLAYDFKDGHLKSLTQ